MNDFGKGLSNCAQKMISFFEHTVMIMEYRSIHVLPAFQYRKTGEDDCCRFIVFINPPEWKVIPK